MNHLYFNVLFELHNRMSFIGSDLLPRFSLFTLRKIFLIKKVESEIDYKSF